MKTSENQLAFFLENLEKSHKPIRAKKMFGEYGLYFEDKFFGMICKEKLFLKATESLKKLLSDDGVRPYEGAGSGYYHIPEELVEIEETMSSFCEASLDFVPQPKRKLKKVK